MPRRFFADSHFVQPGFSILFPHKQAAAFAVGCGPFP